MITDDVKKAILDWCSVGERVPDIVYYVERLFGVRLTYEQVEMVIINYKKNKKPAE